MSSIEVVKRARHECRLPSVHAYDRGTVVRCQRCGRRWKANHPGNPAYSCWRLFLRDTFRRTPRGDRP